MSLHKPRQISSLKIRRFSRLVKCEESETLNSKSHFHLTSVSREASSRQPSWPEGKPALSLVVYSSLDECSGEGRRNRVCVSQLAEVGKTSGVCVGDGSFSFAKGNGIWHTLSLPHHTHTELIRPFCFSLASKMGRTIVFACHKHQHLIPILFQDLFLVISVFSSNSQTASEFCIGVLLQGVLWKPLMWSCMWFLPQCCENVTFSDREVFGKFLVIVL